MANVQHSTLTGADLHEPKGVAAASAGKVYVSNGAGSGAWTTLTRYGELYITSGATAQNLSAASAYARLDPGTEWQSGISSGITLTPADGTFTVVETGVYDLAFWCVFSTDSIASSARYYFKYAINGTPAARTLSTGKKTNGIDTLDVAASGIASLTAGDVISIYVAGDATSSSTPITVLEAGFTLHKT